MARGTTADYAVVGTTIIDSAFEELNLIAVGGTCSATQYAQGLKKLNLLVKNIMGPENRLYRGLKVWQRTSTTITLSSTSSTYTLYKNAAADANIYPPVKLLAVLLRDSDNAYTPLTELTREEYDALPEKSASGDPTRYLYEQLYEYGYLYLDVVPSDTTKSLVITYHRPLYDLDAHTEDVDFPQQWHLPLMYLLIINLAPGYGVDPGPYVPLLEEARENANSFLPERTTVYFQPGKD